MSNPETKDPSTETGINYEALREFFEEYNELLETEDLARQAGEFENQFRHLVTPVEVLEQLGFQRVDFPKGLDPELLEKIKKKRDWYGCPLTLHGGIKRDIIIMQNSSKSVMYFLCRNGRPGLYEWSSLRKSEKGEFEVHEMGPSSNIKGIIGNVGFLEIMGNKNPDTGMPLVPPKIITKKLNKTPAIVEKARDDIEKL